MNLKDINELAEKAARDLGFIIYDIKFAKRKHISDLIIRIDKESGYISVEDCSNFSKKIGLLLDEKDLLHFKYNLRVESPGAERELRSFSDFERFVGEIAKVIFLEPEQNRAVIVGKIEKCEKDMISMNEMDTKKEFKFRYNNVKKANLKLII